MSQHQTHYAYLAERHPFVDDILQNKSARRVIQFTSNWVRAREVHAHVTNRIYRAMVNINIISLRLNRKLHDAKGNTLYGPIMLKRIHDERMKNAKRREKVMKMAEHFVGAKVADELWMTSREQFGSNYSYG